MTRMCCRFIRPRATNGRVKIEVYPNSTLRQDMEEMEALHLGAVQNDRESRIGKAAIDAVNSESANQRHSAQDKPRCPVRDFFQ